MPDDMPEEVVSLKDQALKSVAKGAGISFAGLVLSNIILYFNRLVLARYLGVTDYGLFYLGISIFNIVIIFASLEISSAIVRYIPFYAARKDNKGVKGILVSALKVDIPLSITASVVLFLSSDYLSGVFFQNLSLSVVLKFLSVLLPFFAVFKIGEAGVLSFKRIDYCAFVRDFFRPLVTLLLTFMLLFMGYGLIGATMSYVAGFTLAAIIFMVVIEKKIFPFIKGGAGTPMGKKILKFSIPVALYFTVLSSAMRVDTIILGALRGAGDVGLYQTAMPTAQFLTMPSLALTAIFLPVVAELFSKKKHDDIKETYKIVSKWSFYLCFPLFLVLLFWPDAVISKLFGSEYIAAGGLMGALSVGFLVFNFNAFSTNMISLVEKTKFLFFNGVIALVATISLNVILISLYGVMGAALAMMTVYLLMTVLSVSEAYHFTGVHPLHRDILKAIAAGLVSAVCVYLLTKTAFGELNIVILAFMFIVFLAFYCFLLLVLKGIGKEDVMILRAIERRTGLKIGFLREIFKKFA